MIFKSYLKAAALLSILLSLTGCPGVGENRIEGGITVHMAETHMATSAVTLSNAKALSIQANTTSVQAVGGGYDYINLEHHPLVDKNGRILNMYRAYLVLDNIELIPCTSLSQLSMQWLNAIIPQAHAHAGHGNEPVGGRALDQPNVIDLLSEDEFILPLGDQTVAPGRYCGVRLGLVRLAADGYGVPPLVLASSDDPITVPEIPDLSGRMFAIRADACTQWDNSNACILRAKIDIDDDIVNEPAFREIDFASPLELNDTFREAFVTIGISYSEWLRDIDITLLPENESEIQKLLNNIAGSIHVFKKGLGSLPFSTGS